MWHMGVESVGVFFFYVYSIVVSITFHIIFKCRVQKLMLKVSVSGHHLLRAYEASLSSYHLPSCHTHFEMTFPFFVGDGIMLQYYTCVEVRLSVRSEHARAMMISRKMNAFCRGLRYHQEIVLIDGCPRAPGHVIGTVAKVGGCLVI